ncbi:hypothetical protein KCU81_g1395, partial [Aureobasidium melanogenum]|uniref:Uncharacterized protein n=1 Tax=Aureobasidium melanogenum (strain CBS 110374) TaxID=1043003 RepID=A0A074W0P0_AURM1
MDRQLKDSSLDSTRITDPDLQYIDSLTETASTSMPAAHHQDSPFFRLPLELRYMVYNYAFDCRHLGFTFQQARESIDPLICLYHVSPQVRVEVQAFVANTKLCFLASIMPDGAKARPYLVYTMSHRIKELGTKIEVPASWLWFDDFAPHEFKFWNIILSFSSACKPSNPVIADINLRKGTVRLLRLEKAETRGDCLEHIFEPFQDPSGLAVEALEQPLLAAVQAARKSADLEGFTFREIRRLVEQAVLPGREHFESLEKFLTAPLLPKNQ